MSKKLDKLKEVNEALASVLMKLETQIFIERIDDKLDKTKEQKVEVKLKV